MGEASDPPGHQYARHQQRRNANLSSPRFEELAHDSHPLDRNGFNEFLFIRFAGLREEEEGGEAGERKDDGPVREFPKRNSRVT